MLEEALAEMATRRHVLLGLDFDGTLAQLVDDPDHAEMTPSSRWHLNALAEHENIDVLIISGRGHQDLVARVGDLPGVKLVGEHGNDSGELQEPADLEEVDAFLAGLAAETPGSRIEAKPNSRAFHTRTSPAAAAERAQEALKAWAEDREGIRVLTGKDIVELTVASRTKGDVIAELSADYDGVIYIGDDTTDETVFQILRTIDIGIKVGEGASAAQFRVPDVDAVADILETLDGRRA